MDAVVRLALEKLNVPQRAYNIVRKTQSVEAAAQLAKFCLQSQDFQVGGKGGGRGEDLPAVARLPGGWEGVGGGSGREGTLTHSLTVYVCV